MAENRETLKRWLDEVAGRIHAIDKEVKAAGIDDGGALSEAYHQSQVAWMRVTNAERARVGGAK